MAEKPDMTPVFCRDECGTSVPRCDLEGAGWEYLEIQNRYRCVNCWRLLNEINIVQDAHAGRT